MGRQPQAATRLPRAFCALSVPPGPRRVPITRPAPPGLPRGWEQSPEGAAGLSPPLSDPSGAVVGEKERVRAKEKQTNKKKSPDSSSSFSQHFYLGDLLGQAFPTRAAWQPHTLLLPPWGLMLSQSKEHVQHKHWWPSPAAPLAARLTRER